MQSFIKQGSIFVVVGASIMNITIFASRVLYDNMFTPELALFMMFIISAFVGLIAVRFRLRMLAFCGLILAGIVPIFIHSGVENYVGLFTYLLIVVLGTLWVVFRTEWRDLLVGALCLLTLYSLPHWSGVRTDIDTMTLFAYAFVAIFFTANVVGFLRATVITQANIVSAVWNGFFLLMWVHVGIAPEWQSLVYSFWTVVFLGTAFTLFRFTGNVKPFLAYAAVGVALLGTATATELHGMELAIAFTLEVTALVVLAHALVRSRHVTQISSLLFSIPWVMMFSAIAGYPSGVDASAPLLNENFFALLVFAFALMFTGFSLWKDILSNEDKANEAKKFAWIFMIAGSVYGLIVAWLFFHQAFGEGSGTLVSLALYTVLGISMYVRGIEAALHGVKLYGMFLVGFVVVHLILVDVWTMELFFRIITFFVVGALLMGTAFVNKQKKDITPVIK